MYDEVETFGKDVTNGAAEGLYDRVVGVPFLVGKVDRHFRRPHWNQKWGLRDFGQSTCRTVTTYLHAVAR
jgi:hypothetical protein